MPTEVLPENRKIGGGRQNSEHWRNKTAQKKEKAEMEPSRHIARLKKKRDQPIFRNGRSRKKKKVTTRRARVPKQLR